MPAPPGCSGVVIVTVVVESVEVVVVIFGQWDKDDEEESRSGDKGTASFPFFSMMNINKRC